MVGVVAASPHIAALSSALKIIGAHEERVIYLSSCGLFEEAFQEFENEIQGRTASLFLKLCIAPAIAFSRWRVFLRRLFRNRSKFESILRELFVFFNQAHSLLLLFEMQRELHFFDEAITTGLRLLRDSNSWESGILLLKGIQAVASDSTSSEVVHTRFSDPRELFQLFRRIELQIVIWQTFARDGRPFDATLSLFKSHTISVHFGAILLLELQLGYFLEIVDLPEPLSEICDAAVELMAQGGRLSFTALFQSLARVDGITYQRIVPVLLDSVYRRAASREGFVSFVRENVRGTEFKVMELVRLGFRAEAINIAGGDRMLVRKINQYLPTRS
jgi:hypothetical protein